MSSNNLINLLPHEYVQILRREYLLRLVVVSVFALTFVVLVNIALLVPSFISVRQQIQNNTQQLTQFVEKSTSEEKEVDDRLKTLAQKATYISTLSSVPTASATVRAILALPHANIAITGFTFTAPTKSAAGTMQLTGIAATREALRAYTTSLQSLPFVTSNDLPISDYAQATQITFTDTMTLSYPAP